jgi:hypothetical protein
VKSQPRTDFITVPVGQTYRFPKGNWHMSVNQLRSDDWWAKNGFHRERVWPNAIFSISDHRQSFWTLFYNYRPHLWRIVCVTRFNFSYHKLPFKWLNINIRYPLHIINLGYNEYRPKPQICFQLWVPFLFTLGQSVIASVLCFHFYVILWRFQWCRQCSIEW